MSVVSLQVASSKKHQAGSQFASTNIGAKEHKQPSWGNPGAFAIARNQAGGDWAAAVLLYRIRWRWDTVEKKLYRLKREWVAMSRSQWASESGLSEAEMKNRALPILRKRPFVTIRQMRLTANGPKLLWVSLDLGLLHEWTEPPDMFDSALNGGGIGHTPQKAYPYDHKDD